jgi:hypothetical protein
VSGGTWNSHLFAQVSHVPVIVPLAEHVPGAAEQPTLSGWLCLVGFLLLFPTWYVASCVWWPFARCWLCDGSGRRTPRRTSRVFRNCWWCKGSGRRLRLGRRAWNAVQRRRKAADRG